MADIFHSTGVDVGTEYYTMEVTGDDGKISAFLKLLSPWASRKSQEPGPVALALRKNRRSDYGKD